MEIIRFTVIYYFPIVGKDYFQPGQFLVIEPGSDTQCTAITIIDDSIMEHSELFGISLHLPPDSNERVELNGEGVVTEVAVYDNDGMSTCVLE